LLPAVGVRHLRADGDRRNLSQAARLRGHHAAAGGALDRLGAQFFLDLLGLLHHLLGLLHQVAHVAQAAHVTEASHRTLLSYDSLSRILPLKRSTTSWTRLRAPGASP